MRTTAIAAASVIAATVAAAEPRQHGDVIYDLPPDWSTGATEEGVLILFYDGPEERCEFCSLLIAPGAPAAGPLDAWLAAQAPRLVDADDRGGIEVVQEAAVLGDDPRPFAIQAFTAGRDIYVAFALRAGDRHQLVGFKGWAYDEEEVARSLAFLQDEATPLIDRFRYVPEGAAPLLPAAEPGSLSGLWWGWWLMPTVGIDGMMQMRMDHRTIAFWPDGRFYDGTPPEGLGPLDPAALTAAADPNWGAYREGAGTLTLAYADGRTETLAADGAGWSDGDRTLAAVKALPDGERLAGSVSSFSYTGFAPGAGVEGGMSSSSSTTFFPDGRYEGESFGGASGNFTDGGGGVTGGFATDGGTSASGGAYEVRDGLVVMRPADGSPPTAELGFRTAEGVMIGEQFLEAD